MKSFDRNHPDLLRILRAHAVEALKCTRKRRLMSKEDFEPVVMNFTDNLFMEMLDDPAFGHAPCAEIHLNPEENVYIRAYFFIEFAAVTEEERMACTFVPETLYLPVLLLEFETNKLPEVRTYSPRVVENVRWACETDRNDGNWVLHTRQNKNCLYHRRVWVFD